jgi:23S rRNA pseudouridine955/2504/2580 synthase
MNDTRRQAQHVTIDAESASRRIDNFLVTELKGVPKSRIYRMIRKGEVRVNKGRIKAAYKLKEGDVVRIPPFNTVSEPKKQPSNTGWIKDQILYEDDWLMVLDKPSGLAVHGGSGISSGAIEILRAAHPELYSLELVHRLDRDTSGCLLVAKKRSALRALHAAFREGAVTKIYTALLTGSLTDEVREVDEPLVVDHRKNGERFVRVGKEGKPARTRFTVTESFASTTLTEVELFTGRTHQIRVHASAIGHPVVGDNRYGQDGANLPGLKRLFLHAGQLGFKHPASKEYVEFCSPLEASLERVLNGLRATG